jgi:hypothetical protein
MSENNQTKSKKSNGRGGKRANAGRKVGAATRRTREIADKAAEGGITPLEFMLQIMRNEAGEPETRFEAAKAAAPYVHPRLSAVDVDAKVTARTLAEELAELNAQRNSEDGPGLA